MIELDAGTDSTRRINCTQQGISTVLLLVSKKTTNQQKGVH